MELSTSALSWWTDPIWSVLASSQGISSWISLKSQHSNPNPDPIPLANRLWCIDFPSPPTPLITPHRLPAFLESLMPLKNWCSIQDGRKAVWSIPYVSVTLFLSLKQSGFIRVYSNSCCSCLFEPEIRKIVQSFHKIYSYSILNFQGCTIILNAYTKRLETYWMHQV